MQKKGNEKTDIDTFLKLFHTNDSHFYSAITIEQKKHLEKFFAQALNTIYNNNNNKVNPLGQKVPSINSVLNTVELEASMDKPCKTIKGKNVDESFIGSQANKVCISAYALAKKLDNLNQSKAVFSLAIHGLSHRAGANEDEAKALEYASYAFPDTLISYLNSSKEVKTRIEDYKKDVNSILVLVDKVLNDDKSDFKYIADKESFKSQQQYRSNYGFQWLIDLEENYNKDVSELKKEVRDLEFKLSNEASKKDQNQDLIEQYKFDLNQKKETLTSYQTINKTLIKNTYNYVATGKIATTDFNNLYICPIMADHFEIFKILFNDIFHKFLLGEVQRKLLFDIFLPIHYIQTYYCMEIGINTSFLFSNLDYLFPKQGGLRKSLLEMPPFSKFDNPNNWKPLGDDEILNNLMIHLMLSEKDINKKVPFPRPSHLEDLKRQLKALDYNYRKLSESL